MYETKKKFCKKIVQPHYWFRILYDIYIILINVENIVWNIFNALLCILCMHRTLCSLCEVMINKVFFFGRYIMKILCWFCINILPIFPNAHIIHLFVRVGRFYDDLRDNLNSLVVEFIFKGRSKPILFKFI